MSNRLNGQTSPYLLQHADNPVDWQPWDEGALKSARDSQKPILLSIGYSACHWCHVMAHESFEDEPTARVMNQHFVNIKVDREERPDLDKVYQLAHQLLTQNTGGWPLTMFLDPDTLVPFFGGTYFPRTPQYGLPGFADLLMRVHTAFAEQRDELTAQGQKMSEVLERLVLVPAEAQLEDEALLSSARDALEKQYDQQHGGFGNTPKFPMPTTVERLLRHWAFSNLHGERDRGALDMVMLTLTAMARGGIFDHIGGGFCRYAVDRQWQVPHFEKMLYDNGLLLKLYADALAIGPDALFESAAKETAAWLLREMRDANGGFYSAMDADTEGEEGKFYAWRREQARRLLNEDEYLLVETLYGLDKPANFDSKWVLRRTDSWRSVVHRLSLDEVEASALLASAKEKLFEARETRTRPAIDRKVLAGWNGLVIAGLAHAGQVLHEPAWVDAAEQAADFCRDHLWNGERLLATWKDGTSQTAAYLDDYAYVLMGLLELLRVRWREETARFALQLADTVIERFEDSDNGGFFFTEHDHEQLIHRPKPSNDDALPPGNGVLASVLLSLGHLFAEQRYLDTADRTLAWARGAMEQAPAQHCALLSALESHLYAPETVIIRGPEENMQAWLEMANKGYKPWRDVYAIPYEGVTRLPPYLPRLVSADVQNKPVAYVCRELSCSLPIETLEDFEEAMG